MLAAARPKTFKRSNFMLLTLTAVITLAVAAYSMLNTAFEIKAIREEVEAEHLLVSMLLQKTELVERNFKDLKYRIKQNNSGDVMQYLRGNVADIPHNFPPSFQSTPLNRRSGVSIVLGVPTVRRKTVSYLETTLKSLTHSLAPDEVEDCLIVVFVGETDLDDIEAVANEIVKEFPELVEDGLIEIISAPEFYYPSLNNLRAGFGDDDKRRHWRAKQNLDYVYLMSYAQGIHENQNYHFEIIETSYNVELELAKINTTVRTVCVQFST